MRARQEVHLSTPRSHRKPQASRLKDDYFTNRELYLVRHQNNLILISQSPNPPGSLHAIPRKRCSYNRGSWFVAAINYRQNRIRQGRTACRLWCISRMPRRSLEQGNDTQQAAEVTADAAIESAMNRGVCSNSEPERFPGEVHEYSNETTCKGR